MPQHRPRLTLPLAALLAALAAASGAGRAAAFQTPANIQAPDAIRAAVASAVATRGSAVRGAEIESEVGPIDPRLALPACPHLAVSLPGARAAEITARVSCDAPAWTIYVPVHLHAWLGAVVAAVNLAPGKTIASADLAVGRVDMLASSGALLTDPAEAEGKILRAAVMAGQPIVAPLLDLPTVIRRGQKLVLTLKDSALIIRSTVVALEDGHVGQSILVENPTSRKSVRAVVADGGTVEMQF